MRCHEVVGLRPISVLRFWISEGLTQALFYSKGWNSQVHRGFPAKFESSNLSRDNLSREIGPTGWILGKLSKHVSLSKRVEKLTEQPSEKTPGPGISEKAFFLRGSKGVPRKGV